MAEYWLPLFRREGINLPVILVGNKIDLRGGQVTNRGLEDEIAPIMREFKVCYCLRLMRRVRGQVNRRQWSGSCECAQQMERVVGLERGRGVSGVSGVSAGGLRTAKGPLGIA